jgi:transposase
VSKRRLVLTAVLAGASQSEVARTYGVSQSWISRLMARYALEGEAAFEPRSRRPHTSPNATDAAAAELVLRLRKQLSGAGLDAGADTIGWHLTHHHQIRLSRATIHRILTRAGTVTPQPAKRPKASYLRFQAEMPNETWQSDFTHYAPENYSASSPSTPPATTSPPANHPARPRKRSSPDPQSWVRAMPMSCDITKRARQGSNLRPSA